MNNKWILITPTDGANIIDALARIGHVATAKKIEDQLEVQKKGVIARLVEIHLMLRSILINQRLLLLAQSTPNNRSVRYAAQRRLETLDISYPWIKQ